MYSVYFQQLIELLKAFVQAPLYSRPEFWSVIVTGAAVIVALATPWIVNWLNERPKKSNLVFADFRFTRQDAARFEEEENADRWLGMGRLLILNQGRHIAKSVEAYIDRIIDDGEAREDFLPMPLVWTHGQLNKTGLHVRDIYPSQTVYLDLFRFNQDSSFVGERDAIFAVATGSEFANLSSMYMGESKVYVKFYQESGQVNEVCLLCVCEIGKVPSVTIDTKNI